MPIPFGSFSYGAYSYSTYRIVLMVVAVALLIGLYLLFTRTRFGVLARATIQVPAMAEALGVDTRLIYSLTFGFGAALAGLTGGLYAPTMTIVPTMGATFIMEAFVTVVVGGADVFFGTAPAAFILGFLKAAATSWGGQLIGQIALLVTVIVVIRVLPRGVSGWMLSERAWARASAGDDTRRKAGWRAAAAGGAANARQRPLVLGAVRRGGRRLASSIRNSLTATPSAMSPISSPGSLWRWGCRCCGATAAR